MYKSYGIKCKPTTVKNPQANAILKRMHQVLGQMLRTSELDMADSISPDDVDVFLDNAAWAIRSTYHTVLKASPGAAIFGRDMLFDIPFMADWYKFGEHRQLLTDRNKQDAVHTHSPRRNGGRLRRSSSLISKDSIILLLNRLSSYCPLVSLYNDLIKEPN
jgi:hypothetical protein